MTKKIRLDIYMAENKLSDSREKSQREIISGWVKVNGETIRKPSKLISGNEEIKIERPKGTYVSRGGEKLSDALEYFKVIVKNKVIADLGASTGGFTHCLLEREASLVYSVDVGYGQFDYNLRKDPRVILMERTNVKNLKKSDFTKKVNLIVADLSFISIIKVIDNIKEIFSPVEGIILIKPQFESLRNENKKGVVKKNEHHKMILIRVINSLIKKNLTFLDLTFSQLKGPAGNIEFFLYFKLLDGISQPQVPENLEEKINAIVEKAHNFFYSSNDSKI